MEVQSDVSLVSRPCVIVKTLLPSKLCDFEMFWERFKSRQKPVTCGAYRSLGWSYSEDVSVPLHLEPKRQVEKVCRFVGNTGITLSLNKVFLSP